MADAVIAGEQLHRGDLVVIRDGKAYRATKGDKPDGIWAESAIVTGVEPPKPASFTTIPARQT